MTKLIDLSQDIIDAMPIHPYDDPVKLYQDKFLDKDKYNNHRLEIGMHSGTHIDAPMHLISSKTYINEFTLDTFIGKGILLDVRGQKIIHYKEEYAEQVSENDIILLYTGFSEKYGTEEYYSRHPVIDEELAEFFIEKKVKMVGVDMPSPDHYPFNIHNLLFTHNILILENLTNLSELVSVDSFEIMAFPLKIKAEASMARVVARIE